MDGEGWEDVVIGNGSSIINDAFSCVVCFCHVKGESVRFGRKNRIDRDEYDCLFYRWIFMWKEK